MPVAAFSFNSVKTRSFAWGQAFEPVSEKRIRLRLRIESLGAQVRSLIFIVCLATDPRPAFDSAGFLTASQRTVERNWSDDGLLVTSSPLTREQRALSSTGSAPEPDDHYL